MGDMVADAMLHAYPEYDFAVTHSGGGSGSSPWETATRGLAQRVVAGGLHAKMSRASPLATSGRGSCSKSIPELFTGRNNSKRR
jgi:hypothetical protein